MLDQEVKQATANRGDNLENIAFSAPDAPAYALLWYIFGTKMLETALLLEHPQVLNQREQHDGATHPPRWHGRNAPGVKVPAISPPHTEVTTMSFWIAVVFFCNDTGCFFWRANERFDSKVRCERVVKDSIETMAPAVKALDGTCMEISFRGA